MLEMQRNLYVVRRHWKILVAAAIVGGLLAFGLTKLLIQQQYAGTAIIAMAPPPQTASGLYVTMLTPSADAQLVPTHATALGAAKMVPEVDAKTLARHTSSTASIDNQLLFVSTKWADKALSLRLSNAMATAFIQQERRRLETRYSIIHRGLAGEESHLASLVQSAPGTGAPQTWLRGQLADSASKIYQEDAAARIEASAQESALQLVQPADVAEPVGPKPLVNGALGAALALLLALVLAFVATPSYGQPEETAAQRPFLTKVGD